jgi:small GTP-binding protein
VVIGDSGVGKSSVIESYQYKRSCLTNKATIGADFIKKKIKIKTGEVIPVQIWDTAGQERF